MQRYFTTFLIFAIVAGGGYFLWSRQAEEQAKAQIAERLSAARRSFTERVRVAISEEEAEDYLKDTKAALQAYEKELKEVVYGDYPEKFDLDAKKKEIDSQFAEGQLTEAKHKKIMDRIQLVRAAYDTLMSGRWTPDLTLPGNGETRLDIYDVKRAKGPDGGPLLEASFFLWGIEPNTRIKYGQLVLEYWKEDEPDRKTRRRRRREGRDPDAPVLKRLGSAETDAKPFLLDPRPAAIIREFPSFVVIGVLQLPQVPREAKVMDLRYGYTIRRGGGSVESKLVWEQMPVPSKWQLGENETWMAEEVEATEEELAGVDPDAPDAGTSSK